MKKVLYFLAFVGVGILLQFLVHAGIEMFYINRLLADYGTYGLGLSWETWELIHALGTVLFLLLGIIFGYLAARHWYPRLYDEEGNLRTKRHPLQF